MSRTSRTFPLLAVLAMFVLVGTGCGAAKDNASSGSGPSTTGVDANASDGAADNDSVSTDGGAASPESSDLAGLSQTEGENESSTSDPSAAPADGDSPPTTVAPSTFADIDKALDEKNLCDVYAALSALPLDSDQATMVGQLTRLSDAMNAATEFAPAAVRDDWATVADAMTKVVADMVKDPSSVTKNASAFKAADFKAAQRGVEAWTDESCA